MPSRIPEPPITYLITEGILTDDNFDSEAVAVQEIVRIAVDAGISLIQVREKKLSARNLFHLTSNIVRIAENSATKILVNDRADVASAARADGVQLTEVSLTVDVIRAAFPELIIGASTHSAASVVSARENGADFVLFGPVFSTPGKETPQGLKELEDVTNANPNFPVIAIGGVDKTNYLHILETGCAGFAAIRFLNDGENLKMIGGQYGE